MTKKAALSRFALAFIAGFVSVLLFHQGMLALLHTVNFTPRAPYPTAPTQPLGISQIWSSAFWGGIWGLIWVVIAPRFQKNKSYWLAALVFGAIVPTLVAWFVVAPLKGQPIAGGWKLVGIVTGLLVNGAWGVGTAGVLRLFSRRQLFNS
jgi:phosphotransferase system  glucose/maltose/N-acetylglucosamine-specific IIC component